jgi:hypothetical protein
MHTVSLYLYKNFLIHVYYRNYFEKILKNQGFKWNIIRYYPYLILPNKWSIYALNRQNLLKIVL